MRALRQGGFTLLELLIAMALTALVMAMIGGALVSTLEMQQHVEDKLQTEKTGYGILSLVRRDLEGCYAYALGGPAFQGERATAGRGEADKIKFVTTSEAAPDPQTGTRPKFQQIGYKLHADPNGSGVLSLYRHAAPYVPGSNPLDEASAHYVQVASGIQSFALSYLDPLDRQWKDGAWAETDRIPLAIKVRIDLAAAPAADTGGGFLQASAPHYETVVGLGAVLAPQPDPSPVPGQQPPATPGK